ncbi:MAG: TonB-dependent receptor [Acidobacteriota bacterium]|nr:TonB-dependent receptor [Acidobacteriota bacterium]
MACSILLGILLILAVPRQAGAQATAQLSGTVVDPLGAAVSGAEVRLTNLLTGFERQTATRSDGSFQILNVPFQTYELQVSHSGFATHTQAVQLRSSIPVLIPVQLSLATRKEAIEISLVERITLIDTEATGTRTELNRTLIEQMPVQAGARGLEGILLNFPGFAANANGAVHPRGAHNQMSYVIDGMPISDQFTGSFATSIDPSMVQSLELHTGDIPPDYGSKVSGVANITTHSGFDGGGDLFGMLELGAGQFDTGSAILQLGGAGEKVGYFGSVSAVKSNRFLDSPSLDNLHNGGNAERGFLRLDYHATPKDSLRLSLLAGRSSFQLANLRSQHRNGQQQRRHLRDAAVSLGWVRLISPSTTFDSTTSYRAAVAQLFPSAGDTPVTASLARRLSTFSSFNRFNLLRGRHHWKVGFDYQYFPVSENFFFGITDPRFNHPGSQDFNPNLVPFDLTRGGHWFRFSDKGAGQLQTVFLQDRIKLGRFQLNLGGRYDRYRFLTVGSQLQPRLGVAYHLRETGTVLRASYNRNYQTPPNENLLLSNSDAAGRLAPPDVRRDLSGGVILIGPQRQNVYEVGVQQRLADRASLNAVYFHKDSRDLQDNDNFLNTGIIFPTSLARSNVNGFETRLTLPEIRRFSGSVSTTHYHVVVTPPFTGGLFLGNAALDLLSEGPFVIDHDQKLAVSGLLTYRPRRNWWTSWQVRYDSGLVPNPSDPDQVARDPDYFDQLPLVNLTSDPPRVNARTILDATVGYRHIRGDRRVWDLVFQAGNLTNRTALYNFQSVFVGTRVVQPRTLSAKVRWYW